jgi:alpha-mannosidase
LQKIGHGIELLSRIKAQAFFCLTSGQSKARANTFPVFVYNPHPWHIETTVVAEFNLLDIIFCPDTFWVPSLLHKGEKLPIQAERPHSNLPMDWRKRVCFKATLAPGTMNRFDVTLTRKAKRPVFKKRKKDGVIRFRGKNVDWAINARSGLIEHLRIDGRDILLKGAFKALVMHDTCDPWGMTTDRFDTIVGCFRILSHAKSAEISGVPAKRLKPVRIIEDGPVRTIVEALYGYNDSFLILTWSLPKEGTEIELNVRVLWNEKDKMLKLSVPTSLQNAAYIGDVAYGREVLPATGREVVAQKWSAIVSEHDNLTLTIVNDGTYASSFKKGEMRITLLRSPAYVAHPINDWTFIPDNMFRPRIDQGERLFTFWLTAGSVDERMYAVAREAQIHNEKPMVQWFSPSGCGIRPKPFALLSNRDVQITTIKQAENGEGWIIRLFEPTGRRQKTLLRILAGNPIRRTVTLQPFEIKTLKVDTACGSVVETNLMEETK